MKEQKSGKTNGAANVKPEEAMDVDKKTSLAPYSFEDGKTL